MKEIGEYGRSAAVFGPGWGLYAPDHPWTAPGPPSNEGAHVSSFVRQKGDTSHSGAVLSGPGLVFHKVVRPGKGA